MIIISIVINVYEGQMNLAQDTPQKTSKWQKWTVYSILNGIFLHIIRPDLVVVFFLNNVFMYAAVVYTFSFVPTTY